MTPRRQAQAKLITSICLDRALHERIKDVAADAERSTNAEIVHRLKQSFRREDKVTAKQT